MHVDDRNSITRDGYVFVEDMAHFPESRGTFDTLYLSPQSIPGHLDDVVKYINENTITKVHLDSLPTIEFILACPRLQSIYLGLGKQLPLSFEEIVECKDAADWKYSLQFLCEFEYLEELTIADPGYPKPLVNQKLDCSCMKSSSRLRYLSTNATSIKHMECLTNLEELNLSSLKAENLSQLFSMERLQKLLLCQSTIHSLNGLQNTKLNNLKLQYCRKLADVSAISALALTLEELEIDHCPKISDISICSNLIHLKSLELCGTNSIASLAPLKELQHLNILIVYVNVLDGDLSICKRMQLAACDDRKHYNVKDQDLPKG